MRTLTLILLATSILLGGCLAESIPMRPNRHAAAMDRWRSEMDRSGLPSLPPITTTPEYPVIPDPIVPPAPLPPGSEPNTKRHPGDPIPLEPPPRPEEPGWLRDRWDRLYGNLEANRVVITLDRYRPEIDEALEKLKASKWRIGAEPTDAIQVVKGRELAAFMLWDGEVIRRIEPGSPITATTISDLYTGKKPEPPSIVLGYPLRSSRQAVYTEQTRTRAGMLAHVLWHDPRLDRDWLNTLSFEELISLHGDIHERTVRMDYVRLRQVQPPAVQVQGRRVRVYVRPSN